MAPLEYYNFCKLSFTIRYKIMIISREYFHSETKHFKVYIKQNSHNLVSGERELLERERLGNWTMFIFYTERNFNNKL